MALFGLFGKKKDDVQREVERAEEERLDSTQKFCCTCGRSFEPEEEQCPHCGTRLFIKNENFCLTSGCERRAERHSFPPDEFVCDRCGKPTVVGDICGFNDPVD